MNDLPPRYAVVGAGISGLAAAWELSRMGHVTVYDPDPPGGKLATEAFEGRAVEVGADAFLTRVPDAVELCRQLGMAGELVAPTTGAAMVWSERGLAAMPDGLVLGVPRRLGGLWRSPLISRAGVARAALDVVLPRRRGDGDVAVHHLVAGRFGDQIASRLVDPLVGGIHAGRTEELSAQATTPQLFDAARRSRSLMRALRQSPAPSHQPLFLAPRRGLGSLVERLVVALTERGATFERQSVAGVKVSSADGLPGRPGPGRVIVDDRRGHDGAVLAVPAARAASILGDDAPGGLRAITAASVALVVASFDAAELPAPAGMSGFLVPRSTGRLMTACSFASTKWPHWAAPDTTLVRLSAGRAGDERARSMADGELAARLVDELAAALGRTATPRTVRVARWPDSFPQYRVGHLDLVAGVEAAMGRLPSPVAVAGASYHGAGIPACIASGRRAAQAVAAATPVAGVAGCETMARLLDET